MANKIWCGTVTRAVFKGVYGFRLPSDNMTKKIVMCPSVSVSTTYQFSGRSV